ncbi:EAL domain-containing protein [Sporosarcina sp. PTS2304]|uniref:EAL domain-containing protein n=1 Tax=Sporosarcina sp. PTS2304 TaxID=2283194 RepID=UPI000E0D031F|nr:EAL domain-containing protein [Sporosarcina sp. PTS2304]AXI00253.1 EAL domain-containing protein [Sporosarcina sp. PTS2304]
MTDQTRYFRLANITKLINTKLELRDVLNQVIAAISEEIIQCDSIGIYLPQEDGLLRGFVGKPEVMNGMTIDMHVVDTEYDLLAKEVMETQKTIYVPDTSIDHRPDCRTVQAFNIKSLLALPIILENELFGIVFLFDAGIPMNLTDVEIQSVKSYVDMAAIAIQNAKNLKNKEDLIKEKQLLLDVTHDLSMCSSVHEAINTCFCYISTLLNNNNIGVHLLDTVAKLKIKPTILNSKSDWTEESWITTLKETNFDDENDQVFKDVIATKEAILITDVYKDDRVNHAVCRAFSIQSMFVVPIVSIGEVLGIFTIVDMHRQGLNYSKVNQQLTQSIVNATASTLSNLLNIEKQDQIIKERTSEVLEKNEKLNQTMKELQRLNRERELLLNSAGEGIFGIDVNGVITFCNPTAKSMLGYESVDELQGQSVEQIFSANSKGQGETVFFRQDQSSFPVEYVISSITEEGKTLGEVVTFKDVSERKRMEEEIKYHAYYDSLTNLPNRVLLNDRLEQGLSYAKTNEWKSAVLFMDLDRFKSVNDLLGHSYGDILLAEVANRIRFCIADDVTASRQGGDEFILFFPHIGSELDVMNVIECIIDLFNKPFNLRGHEVYMNCSMGISLFPQDGTSAEVLVKHADIAMYQSKNISGTSYRFFKTGMDTRIIEHVKFENDLYSALEREELEVYFQPQIDYRSKSVVGVEALLRWNHPLEGIVSPDKFIPIAEETGLIVPIGNWVLERACEQVKRWQEDGNTSLCVSVNLSVRQFEQHNLFQTVQDTIERIGLSPKFLCLEITENQIIKNTELTVQTLRQLKELDIEIAIDDFGTGYSSLGYLKNLPINKLKIDKSFIQELKSHDSNSAIAETIITLATNLGLSVIAEGVETEEQAEFLTSKNCYLMQGYYFDAPMTTEAFEKKYVHLI